MTERAVGTWVNGKTIYQRSLNLPSGLSYITPGQTISFNHGIANMDLCVSAEGCFIEASDPAAYDHVNYPYGAVVKYVNLTIVTVYNASITERWNPSSKSVITLWYTKTTDI